MTFLPAMTYDSHDICQQWHMTAMAHDSHDDSCKLKYWSLVINLVKHYTTTISVGYSGHTARCPLIPTPVLLTPPHGSSHETLQFQKGITTMSEERFLVEGFSKDICGRVWSQVFTLVNFVAPRSSEIFNRSSIIDSKDNRATHAMLQLVKQIANKIIFLSTCRSRAVFSESWRVCDNVKLSRRESNWATRHEYAVTADRFRSSPRTVWQWAQSAKFTDLIVMLVQASRIRRN